MAKAKKKKAKVSKKSLAAIIAGAVVLIVALIVGAVLVNNGHKINAIINYGENQKATITIGEQEIEKIESGQGAVGDEVEAYKADGQDIPTVESVDSDGQQVNPEDEEPTECPEGEECGRGASFPYVDTSTPSAFLNATLGGCYNIDGYYDEQCWDYGALFFLNYAGHTLYTCGSGAAKGTIVDGCWQKNATDKFTMIWDATKLQAGDWVSLVILVWLLVLTTTVTSRLLVKIKVVACARVLQWAQRSILLTSALNTSLVRSDRTLISRLNQNQNQPQLQLQHQPLSLTNVKSGQ